MKLFLFTVPVRLKSTRQYIDSYEFDDSDRDPDYNDSEQIFLPYCLHLRRLSMDNLSTLKSKQVATSIIYFVWIFFLFFEIIWN